MNNARNRVSAALAFVMASLPALAQDAAAPPPPQTAEIPWLLMLTILGVVALVVGAVVSSIFRPKREKVVVVKNDHDD